MKQHKKSPRAGRGPEGKARSKGSGASAASIPLAGAVVKVLLLLLLWPGVALGRVETASAPRVGRVEVVEVGPAQSLPNGGEAGRAILWTAGGQLRILEVS